MDELFSSVGRLNRSKYIRRVILPWIFLAICDIVANFYWDNFQKMFHLYLNSMFIVVILLTLIFAVVAIVLEWLYIFQTIKRLHDLDKSGWYFLIHFIPLIRFIFILYLFCAKGTDGENRFGEDLLQVNTN